MREQQRQEEREEGQTGRCIRLNVKGNAEAEAGAEAKCVLNQTRMDVQLSDR